MTHGGKDRMNIAIIGRGNVGQALKSGFERTGHTVRAVGRDAGAVADAAQFADVIILALPYAAIDDAVGNLKPHVAGKIIIDATNALTPDFALAVGFDTSGAEILQQKLPDAHVTKAFHTAFAATMTTGHAQGQQLTGPVAGDDADAKQTVLGLVAALGFDAVDVGPLSIARLLEPFALLNIQLGLVQGLGTDSGFKFVR